MLLYTTLFNKTTIKSDYLDEYLPNFLDTTFKLPKNGFEFKLYTVEKDFVARPDLISYYTYGDSMYTDIICKLNGISNPFELNEGMQLILPSLDYINEFTGKPDKTENNTNSSDSVSYPVAKKSNEKREANEAVVNDSRFKIDAANRIIIY